MVHSFHSRVDSRAKPNGLPSSVGGVAEQGAHGLRTSRNTGESAARQMSEWQHSSDERGELFPRGPTGAKVNSHRIIELRLGNTMRT
jgi:hypothetical protein